jgi:superfamily II DNA or RNA helicase
MAKPNVPAHRKQVLKQRRAEEQRVSDRNEAIQLFHEATRLVRVGDAPAADRALKRALVLHPDFADPLVLLAQIHHNAGHYAEAVAYLRRARKLTDDPTVLFNLGVTQNQMGQRTDACETMQSFLAATSQLTEPRWQKLRQSAEVMCRQLAQTRPLEKKPAPAPPPPTPVAEPPKPSAAPATPPETPRVHVQFLPVTAPGFETPGVVADYFLRRRWIGLRLAQRFEDLLCLPSLQGVDTYVYQQETVRRVLRHFKGRALLADEVGLGKTIEACLILKEYWIRGLVRKALVLSPPSLVSQWKGELTEKFGLLPVSPDTAEFRRNPERFWKEEPLVVASLAMARMEAHAPGIAAVPWDMVIVDEAHCLKNRTSANWRLVDSLHKKFILMLTATPVENNLLELYNLITLLKPGLLDTEADFRKKHVTLGKPKAPKHPEQLRSLLAEVMIRNTRAAADVQLPRRIAATVLVTPSPAEAQIYEMVSRFVAAQYRAPEDRRPPRRSLDLMLRQAGSSPPALRRSVTHALRDESWVPAPSRRALEAILDAASGIEESGKGMQLARMLAAHPGKAVVFTEFLPTLEHLRQVCDGHGISCAVFSGDLSRAEKDAAIVRFRDQSSVLLSTGTGGEGRNLQFADTVVNFDLPWNPMQIEQRIGRVHRIGQTRDVFVFNFCQQATVEEQLLRVLHDKINMFELVVGEMDAILGTLDDTRDFAEIVMDLWIAGRESGQLDQSFEELANRLLDAKKQHRKVQELDEALFAHDFEV